MTARGEPSRGVRAAFAAALAMALISGCQASTSYAGISMAPGAAEPRLQDLARRAGAGDKHAQLELGIAYEEGRGVARDLARARSLYRMAASDSAASQTMIVPHGSSTTAETVYTGGVTAGLAEAARRLGALTSSGSSAGPADELSFGGEVPLRGPTAGAIIDLLKLDRFSHECLSSPREYQSLSEANVATISRCFEDSKLPDDCNGYAASLGKLALLAIEEPSFNVLLPSLDPLTDQCASRTPSPTGDRPRGPIDVSVLDVALAEAREPMRQREVPMLPGQYLTMLCRTVAAPDSSGARLSHILLCNRVKSGGAGRGRDFYINRIRRSLGQEGGK